MYGRSHEVLEVGPGPLGLVSSEEEETGTQIRAEG